MDHLSLWVCSKDTQLILKPCHPKWNSSSYSHKLIACIWEALVFIGYFRSAWCKIRSVLSRNVLWDCLRERLAIKKSRGKLGPNSSPKTVPWCNSPLKKRERNWAELTVAKTFGTVSGGNWEEIGQKGLKDPTTRTATRPSKNNRFYKQNHNFARASHLFVHFFAVFARIRRKNPYLRFMGYGNKQRRNFISLSELG